MISAGIMSGGEPPPLREACLWHALSTEDQAPWLTFHFGQTVQTESRASLRALALRWAGSLEQAGVRSGDRVGVLFPNGPDFVGVFFGAQSLGATAVPLPWPVAQVNAERLREALAPVVTHAQLRVLATTPEMVTDWQVPLVTAPAELPATPRPEAERPAFIQYTSGSTGDPKGSVISQRAASTSALAMARGLKLGPSDVGVSWLPFFHDMGLIGVLLTSLVGGFHVHILRPGEFLLRPRRWLELITEFRASLTVGPNFAYELVTRRVKPDGLDLSSLRCVLNGSEPVHRVTLDAFTEKFASIGFRGSCFLPVYGLAEATLGVCFARPGIPQQDLAVGARHLPCVGTPLEGVDVCVTDPQGQRVVGEEGEVRVRGPVLMNGYFAHPEATRAALTDDGWLRTGDLGVLQHDALYITGREKELVIQAGRKFHPSDIERVVAGLTDSTPNGVAAWSRPDDVHGSEALVVMVELRRQSNPPDAMAIRGELLRTLGVRADIIEFVPAGTLPRTTSGKVKRRDLARGALRA